MSPTEALRKTSPIRSPNLVYLYIGVGVGLALVVFLGGSSWDWGRGYAVAAAIVNAGISAQVAIVYTNYVYPKMPPATKFPGNSPSSYWFGSLGMAILAIGLVAGYVARAGQTPSSIWSIPLVAIGLTILAGWGWIVIRALHSLGRELDG